MKRMISWVLTLVMVLSLLAACGNTATTETPAEPTNAPAAAAPTEAVVTADENLENAIAYLKAFYKDIKTGDLTPADYERLGTVRVAGTAYEVVYTVDCAETVVKVVKGDNGMVTMDVNEANDTETPYTLTATITGTDGKTASLSWNHVVPGVMSSDEIVDSAYALEDGQALGYDATLTGEIIAIDTPYSPDYKNITVTIKVAGREDKPIMCYRLKGEGAEKLMVGDIITVTGSLKNYKGTIEFDAGCNLDAAKKGENTIEIPTDPQEILNAAFELDYGKSLPYPVTLTGKIVGIRNKYSEQYGNISVVIKTGEPWYLVTCYRMKGADADKIWLDDEITVTGNVKNYNGTIEFDTGCQLVSWIDNPDPVAPSDPAKILEAAYTKLNHRDTLPYACTLTGTVTKIVSKYSAQYGNVSVNMTVAGCESMPVQCYRMVGKDAENVAVGDTITVYGWLMNYNGTIEFKQGCELTNLVKGEAPEVNEPADGTHLTIAEAVALGETTNKIRLTGKITEIKNTKYGNLYIQDATGKIYIYGLYDEAGNRFDAMPKQPAVGDTITVYGPVSQYNGEAQIKNAVVQGLGSGDSETPSEPGQTGIAKDLADAANLANKEYLDRTTTFTGTITNDPKASSYNEGQYNFKVSDGTHEITCYYVNVVGGTPVKGDTVTVTGKLTAHNGDPQFDSKSTATLAGGSAPEVPSVNADSSLEDIVAAVKAGAELDFEYTVTGTIKAVYDNDDGTRNVPIITSAGQINCNFIPNNGADWAAMVEGDTISVRGKVILKNGKVRVDGGTLVARTPGATEEEPAEPETPSLSTPAEIIAAAFALESGKTLEGGPFTLTGTVAEITGAYDESYGTLTLNLTVEGRTIQCKYVGGDKAATVAAGDTISVSGNLQNYNGTVQIYKGTIVG